MVVVVKNAPSISRWFRLERRTRGCHFRSAVQFLKSDIAFSYSDECRTRGDKEDDGLPVTGIRWADRFPRRGQCLSLGKVTDPFRHHLLEFGPAVGKHRDGWIRYWRSGTGGRLRHLAIKDHCRTLFRWLCPVWYSR